MQPAYGKMITFKVSSAYSSATTGDRQTRLHANGGIRISRRPCGFANGSFTPKAELTEERKCATQRKIDEQNVISVWDSNAEGIRRSWRQKGGTTSVPDLDEARAGARSKECSDAVKDWQWWKSSTDDDDYENDMDEEDSGFAWVFAALRWVIPAAAVTLPWLSGGPMYLMMAFTFFPVAQRFLGPVFLGITRGVLSIWRLPRRKKPGKQFAGKRSKKSASAGFPAWTEVCPWDDSSREEGNGWAGDSEQNQGQYSQPYGWDDLGGENVEVNKPARVNRSKGLGRRRRRREVPLLVRLMIALFPFLRSWGGFL